MLPFIVNGRSQNFYRNTLKIDTTSVISLNDNVDVRRAQEKYTMSIRIEARFASYVQGLDRNYKATNGSFQRVSLISLTDHPRIIL